MLRARRRKRASVTDLYKSCQLGGDCLPDVKNKVEGTTLADRLLSIFGSILYLGNLGIGTGRGSGGWGGYKPLGGVAGRSPEISVSKPSIPIDPTGGAELIPLNVIDAEAPSIIPLTDGIPEVPQIDTGPNTIDVAELDVTTQFGATDIGATATTNQQPTVISGPEISVIDYQPGPPLPKRIALDVGFKPYQDIQLNVFPEPKNFDSNINVFVDPNITGENVGFEEIELSPLSNIADFDIEEAGPKTSTPTQLLGRVTQQSKQLYNRIVQQVQTRNPEFIRRPSRLVTFDFENPAFEDEVTLRFEQDVNQVAAAPDTDFADIATLSRPYLTETSEGVRVSRIGQKASIRTRSGLQIGQKVHYYYDVSPIPREPDIEMRTYGSYSGEAEIVNPIGESTFIDITQPAIDIYADDDIYPDELLLDPMEETFENSQIVISSLTENNTILQIPTYYGGIGLYPTPFNFTKGLTIDWPRYTTETVIVPPLHPVIPIAHTSGSSSDFVLHPDLMKKKRKRKLDEF